VRFRFDNVPFVCNLIDAVAGETRFLEIRKRKPRHSTLRMVEARAAEAREREQTEINKSRQRYEEEEKKADEEAKKVYADLQKVVDDLQAKQRRGEEVDLAELEAKVAQLQIKRAFIERQLNVTKERLKRERDQELAAIERKRDQEIQRIQNEYKIQATVFPPILPLLVGLVVWTRRRIREREGISRARMRTA
jgi:ABC-2 type transport system permease protein